MTLSEKGFEEILSKITPTATATSNKKHKKKQQSLKAIEKETLLLLDEAERYCNANILNYIGFLERYNKATNSF
ncbi:MAG: hypothetical protein ACJ718_05995 [Nitrososphaeraceae archaeon]